MAVLWQFRSIAMSVLWQGSMAESWQSQGRAMAVLQRAIAGDGKAMPLPCQGRSNVIISHRRGTFKAREHQWKRPQSAGLHCDLLESYRSLSLDYKVDYMIYSSKSCLGILIVRLDFILAFLDIY